MSPTSQGALEVERYIGSCLISTNSRQKQQLAGTWAGGAPLISMANPRRNLQAQQRGSHHQAMNDGRVPLSRLAVHTQGAPLILASNRYHNNNNSSNRGKMHQQANNRCQPSQQQQQQQQRLVSSKPVTAKEAGTVAANIDSLSIASDESSGSNNSENSLPRIIKPRKRRKKERKPPLLGMAVQNCAQSTEAKQPEEQPNSHQLQQQPIKPNYQAYEPVSTRSYPGDNYFKGHRRPNNNNNNYRASMQQMSVNNAHEVVDTRQQHRSGSYAAHRHAQVKVLDDNRNVIQQQQQQQKAGYLRNSSPMSGGARYTSNELTCQQHPEVNAASVDECPIGQVCQYCDPATLIWDVSEQQNRYSPHYLAVDYYHHHHHHHRFSQIRPATLIRLARPVICQEHPNAIEFFDLENPCPRTAASSHAAIALRRSWSDPTSYSTSEEIVPNRDVGVIGDRGGESSKSRSSWRGDAGCASAGPLEVSTQIVTSANGHRDLEIKFYSSSSPTASCYRAADDSSNALTFPDEDDDDDSEEFSDIWSYHESKLQQDFRTLLQAEE